MSSRFAVSAIVLACALTPAQAEKRELVSQKVEVRPGVNLPIAASMDWARPPSDVRRAVIVLNGLQRNVQDYFRFANEAAKMAGAAGDTIVIAPQFLTEKDAREVGAPDSDLRFGADAWSAGEPAKAPAPVSSFEALDALLSQLSDRARFPQLERIVVIGHSAGGQLAQRFAILTQKDTALAQAHIALRFVVADPSSYAYFGAERPYPEIAKTCPGYNDWKFGFATTPPYDAGRSASALEAAYVARDVVYVLGSADNDPNQAALDRSCMAEAQGPTRWDRGHAFLANLRARDDGAPKHKLRVAVGVAHNAQQMLTSPCGLAAVFDTPGCPPP